ncbi:MAG: glycosyltransferase family 2 protein [Chloroflexi bacterium]|nr:glycosyltransferase family 2 protein [Chloroflexota bacterium]
MSPRGPLVTVVVPTWNREAFLPRSLASVRGQTLKDWELIVVDDASTDGSTALVQQIRASDPRVTVIPNTHRKGPAGARNCGVEVAAGRYVAFLDSDDEWEPFHLARMVDCLSAFPEQLDLMTANAVRKVHDTGDVYWSDELDLSHYQFRRLGDAYVFRPDTLFQTALRRRIVTTQTIVCRREVLDKVRFDETIRAAEDCLFARELAYRRIKIGHLQEYHVTYWAHADNLVNAAGNKAPQHQLDVNLEFEKYYEILLSRFLLTPTQRTMVKRELAECCFWDIGYNCCLQLGRIRMAYGYFLKAVRLWPTHPHYWKAIIAQSYRFVK